MVGLQIFKRARQVAERYVQAYNGIPVANISDCLSRLTAAGPRLRRLHKSGGLSGAALTVMVQGLVASAAMVIAGAAEPANETRIEGADLLAHPIAALASQYVELVHADKIEDAMRLASTEAQQEWKAEPASERAASAAFRKKNGCSRPSPPISFWCSA